MIIQQRTIEKKVIVVRGKKVILDTCLAELYGIQTKRLNEQVKRNARVFPSGSLFRLSQKEKEKVVATCDHLHKLTFSKTLPNAFTIEAIDAFPAILRRGDIGPINTRLKRAFEAIKNVNLRNGCNGKELTEREKAVLEYIREGKTNKEIADCCSISLNTVKYHVRRMLRKTGVERKWQLMGGVQA